jgi:hypothetical protein
MIALAKGSLPTIILVMLSIMSVPHVEEPVLEQGSEWNFKIVDFVGEYGGWPSLALDSSDYPHMSFTDYPKRDIKYGKWTGYGWSIEIIDSVGGWTSSNSLALDSNDYARVGYFDVTNGATKYAKWDGSTWTNETVDATFKMRGGTSLALDGDDYPRMSYIVNYEPPNIDASAVRYASWNGTTWKFKNVDYVPLFIGGTSLDLDSNDYPHVGYSVYHADQELDLKYAKWNGSSWIIETVDYIDDVGGFPSLAIDSNDYPHIGYRDYGNRDLKYATWNGNEWHIEAVESVGDVGWFVSLALDENDYPHMSHFDAINRDLKYVRWNGSAWSTEVVDSIGDVGQHTSLAIDSDGNPHISYLDSTNDNLKYATKADLQPPPRTISFDLDPDTLNLKSRGRWVTAYLSAENASVRDIDISTVLLQGTMQPERYDYQGDVLMLKFNRNQLQRILPTGESVEVKISGKWNDGSDFEAYDYIRVINPPLIQLPPRFRNPSPIIR